MVIAVSVVRVMQMPTNQVVDVVAMRDRFMAATRSMNMPLRMTCAAVRGRADGWVCRADFERALIDMPVVSVVKVTVVQVVQVVTVPNGLVAAIGPVNVLVVFMGAVIHGFFFLLVVGKASGSPACCNAVRMSSRMCSSERE